jgi:hypothetical protein
MIFKVHMFALMGPGQVREVEVPDDVVEDGSTDQINRAVFHCGQNDRQRSGSYVSVSAGDVIEWPFAKDPRLSRFFLIELLGYQELTREQFEGMSLQEETSGASPLKGLRMVHGIDPLAAMPTDMKVTALIVLHHLFSSARIGATLIGDGILDEESFMRMQEFVANAMEQLRMAPESGPPA